MISGVKRIIVDTNALMAITELGIDVFGVIASECLFAHKVYVLSGTIGELEKIRDTQSGAFKTGAKVALQVLAKSGVTVIPSLEDNVDNELVICSQKGDMVLTQDRELKKRLVKPYLTIRQRKRLLVVD